MYSLRLWRIAGRCAYNLIRLNYSASDGRVQALTQTNVYWPSRDSVGQRHQPGDCTRLCAVCLPFPRDRFRHASAYDLRRGSARTGRRAAPPSWRFWHHMNRVAASKKPYKNKQLKRKIQLATRASTSGLSVLDETTTPPPGAPGLAKQAHDLAWCHQCRSSFSWLNNGRCRWQDSSF